MKQSKFYLIILIVTLALSCIFGRTVVTNAIENIKNYKKLVNTADSGSADVQQKRKSLESIRLTVLGPDYKFTHDKCGEALTELLQNTKAEFVDANAFRTKNSDEILFVCAFDSMTSLDIIPEAVNMLEVTVTCVDVTLFVTALDEYKPLNVIVYPQDNKVTFSCVITDGGELHD